MTGRDISSDPYARDREPQQRTELVYVTREWAESALAVNDDNRRVSPSGVRVWADRFNRRRYRLTHQGIAFDQYGRLFDGQHRLLGFLMSTCPGFWASVTNDVDRNGFAATDTGLVRQPGQLIPGAHANTKAAAARLLMLYPRVSYPSRRVDPEDVIDVYTTLADSIDAAAEMAVRVYRGSNVNKSMLTAILTLPIASEFDRSMVQGFCEGVETGAGLAVGDARLALRNRWAIEGGFLNGVGRESGLYLIARAWNAYAGGESITRLQLPRGGSASNTSIPEVTR